MAGHDLNYLAVSGVLSILGPSIRLPPLNHPLPPSPPGNILGDFAGGGLVCFVGILLALISRTKTGKGQIVEANMVDGVSYLATAPRISGKIPGQWDQPRGQNLVDGGCPYYNVYECKDEGKYMAVASLEPKFFEALSHGLRLCDKDWGGSREDRKNWPMIKMLFEKAFRTKTRKEWEAIFDGTDACCTPVLTHEELELNNYEQRPLVSLKNTPSRMPDNGWAVKTLSPGIGGEYLLRKWAGWKENKDYVTVDGGLYNKEAAKM
jgi:alpha-methylacyl-CoA racemase